MSADRRFILYVGVFAMAVCFALAYGSRPIEAINERLAEIAVSTAFDEIAP